MTRHLSKLSLGIAAVLVSASLAVAQTTPATPVAPPAAVKAPPTVVVPPKADAPAKGPAAKTATTPWGIHCSAEADKQALKGAPREKFRAKCIRDYKKANPTATSTSKPVVPAGASVPAAATAPAGAPPAGAATTAPPAAKKN